MSTTDDTRGATTDPAAGVLEPRKAAILNAVVAEYIETAQPVGSRTSRHPE